jgi:hypothetical protein
MRPQQGDVRAEYFGPARFIPSMRPTSVATLTIVGAAPLDASATRIAAMRNLLQ